MKQIARLVTGMAVGVSVGLFGPPTLVATFSLFKLLFGQLLGFSVPLIILFYIMSGIGGLQRGSGRMLSLTVGLAYVSTVLAGCLTFLITQPWIPDMVPHDFPSLSQAASTSWLPLSLPPLMDVSTALVTALVFGTGLSAIGSQPLASLVEDARRITERLLLNVIVPGLPLYVGAVFAEIAAAGAVVSTLSVFVGVLGLAIVLHWGWLTLLFTLAGCWTGRNPLTMLRTMLPCYLTAVGTMSSAAAIPVTMACVRKMKVSSHVTDFSVPLCATIHISGSVITLTVCTLAVQLMSSGTVMNFPAFVPFILALGVTLVAAPGVPGGAVTASTGLLISLLGFDDAAVALMISLYLAQDSFGTACNVAGDGAIAALVDKMNPGSADARRKAQSPQIKAETRCKGQDFRREHTGRPGEASAPSTAEPGREPVAAAGTPPP
ncbi:MAG: dicarboxylate/amino acid:cation symporter [Kistimonas sp.]|nr:dicarboxylate/amino acid:cation symporter [Kistimonas sp.]